MYSSKNSFGYKKMSESTPVTEKQYCWNQFRRICLKWGMTIKKQSF